MKIEMVENESSAKIKVIGIGGGGGNAINDMIKAQLVGVDFLSANTDSTSPNSEPGASEVKPGNGADQGIGGGGRPGGWA